MIQLIVKMSCHNRQKTGVAEPERGKRNDEPHSQSKVMVSIPREQAEERRCQLCVPPKCQFQLDKRASVEQWRVRRDGRASDYHSTHSYRAALCTRSRNALSQEWFSDHGYCSVRSSLCHLQAAWRSVSTAFAPS